MVAIISSLPTTLNAIESPTEIRHNRSYLGMSEIGSPCTRYLWYSFRWAFKAEFPARMIRLFSRGHDEEPKVIRELEKVGIVVHSMQQEFIDGWGHIRGHCDGMCDNVIEAPQTRHLLEIKTMNDKYFKAICKQGLKASNQKYYGQCQVGMRGYELTRTLFISVNKNDDSYYIERIKHDEDYSDNLITMGKGIILSEVPPTKVFKPTWYLCKFCDARFTCHFKARMVVSCRTCTNVEIGKNASWSCGLDERLLTTKDQLVACSSYNAIPNY